VAGEQGVADVLILNEELDFAMALIGCRCVAAILADPVQR